MTRLRLAPLSFYPQMSQMSQMKCSAAVAADRYYPQMTQMQLVLSEVEGQMKCSALSIAAYAAEFHGT